MNRDPDLERLFLEARAEDERHVPSFARVLAARPAAPRASRLRLALALAVVALAAFGLWRLRARESPRLAFAFTPGEMRVPTDYLLDLTTYPRAGEIPRLGAPEWFPLPVTDDAGPHTRRLP